MVAIPLAVMKFDLPVLVNGTLMAGTLLAGAAVIALVRRWWKREEPSRDDAGDQLAHFRSLYEKGELSEEEYKRLRKLLGGQLRQSLHLPAQPAKQEPRGEAGPSGQEPPTEGIRPA